jgi:hypothetical protein
MKFIISFFLCLSFDVLALSEIKEELAQLGQSYNSYAIRGHLRAILRAKSSLSSVLSSLSPEETQRIFDALLRARERDYDLCDELLKEFIDSFRSRMEKNDIVSRTFLNIVAPYLYKINMKNFSKMIFSEPQIIPGDKNIDIPDYNIYKIIYNNNGYWTRNSYDLDKKFERGRPLEFDSQTPIGYNIYLPTGEIKAIVTEIYGGDEYKSRYQKTWLPGDLRGLHEFLLAHNIAIVRLNLLDLRELEDFQARMPHDIHRRLHASICKYFLTFKIPSLLKALHPDLFILHDKPNFLSGSSFGGCNTLRFAEYYPDTFSGYLSFNGSLDFEVQDKTDIPAMNKFKWRTQKAQQWLDPSGHLKTLQDPVLLVHNLDDNTVSAAVSIAFYLEASKKESKNLKLLLIDQGSPMPTRDIDQKSKGHFLVMQKSTMNYILEFIIQNSSLLPSASEFRAQVNRHRGYGISTECGRNFLLPEKHLWLAELFNYYYASKPLLLSETMWEKEYLPIIQALALLKHCLLTPDLYKIIKHELRAQSFGDEFFIRALQKDMPRFAQFLMEKYNFKIDVHILGHMLINNHKILSVMKEWVFNSDQEISICFYNYLVFKLMSVNAVFTSRILDKIQGHLKAHEVNIMKENFLSARQAFFSDIHQSRACALRLWQQAYKAVLNKRRLLSQGS